MIEKRLRKYIFPSVLAMTGVSIYILADTFFISIAGGSDGICALNLILPIYCMVFALAALIGTGAATRYSIIKASGGTDANRYFSNAVFFSIIVSIPFIVCGLFIPDQILILLGADENVLEVGVPYFRTAMCFAPFFILNNVVTSFVRNDGSPKIVMVATLVSSFFNIIFDYVFMFPMGLGMFGAALATGVSPIVSITICSIHFFTKNNTITFEWKLPSFKRLYLSCILGVSGFIGEIASGVTGLVFNFILLSVAGNNGLAAYGIIANISIVCIAMFNGVAQGLQPMASEAEGRKEQDTKRRVLNHSALIGGIISVILVAVLCIFATPFVTVFNSEGIAELQAYGEVGLRIYSIGFLFAGMNIVIAGYFAAVDKPRECAILSLARGVVAIVFFALLLSSLLGIIGVWLAFVASEATTLILSVVLLAKTGNLLAKKKKA